MSSWAPNNDLSIFYTRPLSLTLLVLSVLALILPFIPRVIGYFKGREATKLSFSADD